MNSTLILLEGEAAICTFPDDRVIESLSNSTPIRTPPAVGLKIGDGQHYFYELPLTFNQNWHPLIWILKSPAKRKIFL